MSPALRIDLSAGRLATLALIALAAMVIAAAPLSAAGPGAMPALAIVAMTVALLATGALPVLIIAALFFALALGTGSAPPMALISGLWANATLLIFGGLVIGSAAERSGLGRYVARRLLQPFRSSYPRLLLGILLGTFALSFLLPSTMARLAITLPIVTAVCHEAGYAPGSKGYIGTVMTTVAGNFTTSYAILPANLTNVLVMGAGETLLGVRLGYLEYLALCGPVLGAVKGATFLALVVALLPAPPPAQPAAPEPVPLSRAARRLAVVLAITVTLWASDVVHGLKPGVIALGAAVLCLLPPLALVRLGECFDPNRVSAVIIVPTVQGVAAVLTHSGAGALISAGLLALIPLPADKPAAGFTAIALVSALVAIPATITGAIAVVTPLIGDVAAATGMPAKLGIIAEMVGLQAPFFHFMATPILVGTAIARVSPMAAARLLLPVGVVGLLVVLPLEVAWLKAIGAMP